MKSIPEIRATEDLDAQLLHAAATLEQVLNSVISTPGLNLRQMLQERESFLGHPLADDVYTSIRIHNSTIRGSDDQHTDDEKTVATGRLIAAIERHLDLLDPDLVIAVLGRDSKEDAEPHSSELIQDSASDLSDGSNPSIGETVSEYARERWLSIVVVVALIALVVAVMWGPVTGNRPDATAQSIANVLEDPPKDRQAETRHHVEESPQTSEADARRQLLERLAVVEARKKEAVKQVAASRANRWLPDELGQAIDLESQARKEANDGLIESAIVTYEQATKLYRDLVGKSQRVAQLHAADQRHAEVVSKFDPVALETSGGLEWARISVKISAARDNLAAETLDTATELLDAAFPIVHLRYAEALVASNQQDEAMRVLSDALIHRPQDQDILATLKDLASSNPSFWLDRAVACYEEIPANDYAVRAIAATHLSNQFHDTATSQYSQWQKIATEEAKAITDNLAAVDTFLALSLLRSEVEDAQGAREAIDEAIKMCDTIAARHARGNRFAQIAGIAMSVRYVSASTECMGHAYDAYRFAHEKGALTSKKPKATALYLKSTAASLSGDYLKGLELAKQIEKREERSGKSYMPVLAYGRAAVAASKNGDRDSMIQAQLHAQVRLINASEEHHTDARLQLALADAHAAAYGRAYIGAKNLADQSDRDVVLNALLRALSRAGDLARADHVRSRISNHQVSSTFAYFSSLTSVTGNLTHAVSLTYDLTPVQQLAANLGIYRSLSSGRASAVVQPEQPADTGKLWAEFDASLGKEDHDTAAHVLDQICLALLKTVSPPTDRISTWPIVLHHPLGISLRRAVEDDLVDAWQTVFALRPRSKTSFDGSYIFARDERTKRKEAALVANLILSQLALLRRCVEVNDRVAAEDLALLISRSMEVWRRGFKLDQRFTALHDRAYLAAMISGLIARVAGRRYAVVYKAIYESADPDGNHNFYAEAMAAAASKNAIKLRSLLDRVKGRTEYEYGATRAADIAGLLAQVAAENGERNRIEDVRLGAAYVNGLVNRGSDAAHSRAFLGVAMAYLALEDFDKAIGYAEKSESVFAERVVAEIGHAWAKKSPSDGEAVLARLSSNYCKATVWKGVIQGKLTMGNVTVKEIRQLAEQHEAVVKIGVLSGCASYLRNQVDVDESKP